MDIPVELNRMLLKNMAMVEIPAESSAFDAFGSPFVNPNEPMPSVKLSGFEVTLRSMFNGQPCQYRYNRIDDGSYPITAENRSLIKKSLEWIYCRNLLLHLKKRLTRQKEKKRSLKMFPKSL